MNKLKKNYIKLNKALKLKGLKKCTCCDKVKDLSNFTKLNENQESYRARCKDCYREINKKYEQKYHDTTRKQKKYNLSKYELSLLMDKNKCEICNKEIEGRNKNIDHCHNTQFVRGILCKHCNLGLGHFQDNELRLFSAIAYLRKARTLQMES